jgi:hypothetical protein
VQGRHKKVAGSSGSVSGKNATGAIGPVGCRSQPDDEEACRRIAKARHWAHPIRLVQEGTAFHGCDVPAMLAEPRAAFACNDVLVDITQRAEEWGD